MEKELGFEKEIGLGLGLDGLWNEKGDGLKISIPPSPPSKDNDLPQTPPATEPPNRPLPPTPTTRTAPSTRPSTSSSGAAPMKPPPTRPPPLRPQAPLRMNPPTRPGTAASQASVKLATSTKRLSLGSIASSRRPIKYGQGKYRNIELIPQPSDDPDDPLNWPMWRKELNFYSLLIMVAMTGVMKTIFLTVNAQLAEGYQVSYTAAAALTGVPLMISAFTGFICLIASRVCGKRPLYLASLLLVFIGTVWNTNVQTSYAECMAARVFQGLGWGAFDALVLGSIQDTYFEHQRGTKTAICSIVAVSTTWGAPLLGGVASQSPSGFGMQFSILSIFFIVAVPAIVLGAPETVFDRAYTLAQTPNTGLSTATSARYKTSLPLAPRKTFSVEMAKTYLSKMKPYSYTTGYYDSGILLQAPRAFVAPTTMLAFLISFLPYCALWGLGSSLALLLNPMPFRLSPANIGALFTGPWIMATATAAVFALVLRGWWSNINTISTSRIQMFAPKTHMITITVGSILSFIGILTFGLHIDACMTRPDDDDGMTSVYALEYLGNNVNLPAVSFLLGLLAMGVYVLDATARPLIRASTMFTSSNLGVALRNTTDMGAGVGFWRSLMAGVFVMGIPNATWSWDGLRSVCMGLAIAQVIVAAVLGSIWWLWGEDVRRWDGRIMKLVDLDMLKRSGSFFDTD